VNTSGKEPKKKDNMKRGQRTGLADLLRWQKAVE
jgi:hypothetical protein